MIGVLGPLATFAGGLTIATQFIIQCPDSRLQVLLAMTSELFLASVLGTVVMYLILYGLDEQDPVIGRRRHCLIFQFCIVGFMFTGAFMLLAVALMVAVQGTHVIGIIGLVLIGILVAGAIFMGCVIMYRRRKKVFGDNRLGWNWAYEFIGEKEEERDHRFNTGENQGEMRRSNFKDLVRYQQYPILAICILEVVAIGILLGWGGMLADKAGRQYGCSNGTTVALSTPLPTFPVSIAQETSASWPQTTNTIQTIKEIDNVITVIVNNPLEWHSQSQQMPTTTTTSAKTTTDLSWSSTLTSFWVFRTTTSASKISGDPSRMSSPSPMMQRNSGFITSYSSSSSSVLSSTANQSANGSTAYCDPAIVNA